MAEVAPVHHEFRTIEERDIQNERQMYLNHLQSQINAKSESLMDEAKRNVRSDETF